LINKARLQAEQERKASEEQQQEAERAEKKRTKKIQADASKMSVKLGLALGPLQEALKDVAISHVPKFAVTKGTVALKNLQAAELECQARLAAAKPRDLPFSMEDITEKAKAGIEAKGLINTFLLTARKHAP
jgi:hypothetical protein